MLTLAWPVISCRVPTSSPALSMVPGKVLRMSWGEHGLLPACFDRLLTTTMMAGVAIWAIITLPALLTWQNSGPGSNPLKINHFVILSPAPFSLKVYRSLWLLPCRITRCPVFALYSSIVSASISDRRSPAAKPKARIAPSLAPAGLADLHAS